AQDHSPAGVSVPMRVAILYNPRPEYDTGELDDAFEEYDEPETFIAITKALAGMGVEPMPVIADEEFPWKLKHGGFDFVFNIAEGAGRRCREAVPAAICEFLRLPVTGSDALTLATTPDKPVRRRRVSPWYGGHRRRERQRVHSLAHRSDGDRARRGSRRAVPLLPRNQARLPASGALPCAAAASAGTARGDSFARAERLPAARVPRSCAHRFPRGCSWPAVLSGVQPTAGAASRIERHRDPRPQGAA